MKVQKLISESPGSGSFTIMCTKQVKSNVQIDMFEQNFKYLASQNFKDETVRLDSSSGRINVGIQFNNSSRTIFPKKVAEIILKFVTNYTGSSVFPPVKMHVNYPTLILLDFSDQDDRIVDQTVDNEHLMINGFTLKDIHKHIKNIDSIYCNDKITDSVLGLLLIEHSLRCFEEVVGVPSLNEDWMEIVNKHLSGDKDVLECKTDLIEKGFPKLAKI
jgi:hypothetical protein